MRSASLPAALSPYFVLSQKASYDAGRREVNLAMCKQCNSSSQDMACAVFGANATVRPLSHCNNRQLRIKPAYRQFQCVRPQVRPPIMLSDHCVPVCLSVKAQLCQLAVCCTCLLDTLSMSDATYAKTVADHKHVLAAKCCVPLLRTLR